MKLSWHQFQPTFLLQKHNIKNSVKVKHPYIRKLNTWAKFGNRPTVPPPGSQSPVSEMQHAKLEFRTFMNFVIILQKKSDEIALFSFLQARELQKTVV